MNERLINNRMPAFTHIKYIKDQTCVCVCSTLLFFSIFINEHNMKSHLSSAIARMACTPCSKSGKTTELKTLWAGFRRKRTRTSVTTPKQPSEPRARREALGPTDCLSIGKPFINIVFIHSVKSYASSVTPCIHSYCPCHHAIP
jgi:hypothetical protein